MFEFKINKKKKKKKTYRHSEHGIQRSAQDCEPVSGESVNKSRF